LLKEFAVELIVGNVQEVNAVVLDSCLLGLIHFGSHDSRVLVKGVDVGVHNLELVLFAQMETQSGFA
jgi:hypothetical protein